MIDYKTPRICSNTFCFSVSLTCSLKVHTCCLSQLDRVKQGGVNSIAFSVRHMITAGLRICFTKLQPLLSDHGG